MMPDPAAFLSARLAEDQARLESLIEFVASVPLLETAPIADGTVAVSWSADSQDDGYFLRLHPAQVEVWFREDPRRFEHDLQARRLIVSDHGGLIGGRCPVCVEVGADRSRPVSYPCRTLRLLTWRYAEHPDYDESWDAP